jgi:hypothetical protein
MGRNLGIPSGSAAGDGIEATSGYCSGNRSRAGLKLTAPVLDLTIDLTIVRGLAVVRVGRRGRADARLDIPVHQAATGSSETPVLEK